MSVERTTAAPADQRDDTAEWALAEASDGWLRPAGQAPAEPRWGHPDGLQLGLHPLDGPRGLLRLYAPYLGHDRDRLVNFIAVEPVPAGRTERGYSELEPSRLDGVPGLRFWSSDDPTDASPRDPEAPARGVIETRDGVEWLHVHVLVEPYANGADVWVRASFRKDRPHEITVAAFARETSVELDACVLTATMGNYARLRELHLRDRTVTSGELWPDYREIHFAEHARFGVGELRSATDASTNASTNASTVSVSATPDELAPHEATYSDDTAEHWRYSGRRAVQTWTAQDPDPSLEALVNGRYTYWSSESPIPGGIAFENFELVEPFRQGRQLTFSIEPLDE
jgi:hypothetical protein